jgi:eukaryotic-like serine/threonine-protein kinase
MSLAPGARLGVYVVVSPLGAGGMGEVYRARDTTLNRDVALKVLLPDVANDPDRVARFQREAEVLARLNHPGIAHLYGIERSDGTLALVMELVEGETLAERLANGPIAAGEALAIATQIAEALEYAHEQGIIHRDLKPANIKVREDGSVKVLDFGLAKAMEPTAASASRPELTNSPTLTSPALMTGAGVLLGTAGYMSPEQARGRSVDRRSDVWAFGCVLYEMLTGQRAFAAGESVSDTIAAILTAEPDLAALPGDVPEQVRRVLAQCFVKDPRRRLSHIAIAAYLLEEGRASHVAPPQPGGAPAGQQRRLFLATAIALLVGALAASAASWWFLRTDRVATVERPIRFTITASTAGETWRVTTDRPLALSPDGRTLAYRGATGGRPQLFVRSLDALEARAVTDTDLRSPFFSPDSQWIGFFSPGGELRKVRVSGGPAVTICTCGPPGSLPAGASWGDDDTIVFALAQATSTEATPGLFVVPASGGEHTVLTMVDAAKGDGSHMYPFVLPGSRGVLYRQAVVGRPSTQGRIMLLDRASGARRELAAVGSGAEFVRDHIVYADENGRLQSIPFDPAQLRPTGPPMPLPEQVHVPPVGQPLFSSAVSGALAFVPALEGGGVSDTTRSLVWVTRQGREEPIPAPARAYALARLSPDAQSIALDIRDQQNDIWVWSIARAALTRLTTGPTLDMAPVWTSDGRRIVWTSTRESTNPALFWQAADGTGTPERLGGLGQAQFPTAATPDGRYVLLHNAGPGGIQRIPLAGEPRVETVLRAVGRSRNSDVSPDGRWVAYESDESGQPEIYARPYPNVDAGRWQLSSAGGTRPVWARSGRELFFLDATQHLSVVPIAVAGSALVPSAAKRVLETTYYPGFSSRGNALRGYDVAPDGERFLMIKGANEFTDAQSVVTVALNWSPVP